MENSFLPFDLALKLKELGFNEFVIAKYQLDSDYKNPKRVYLSHPRTCNALDKAISAPFYSDVLDWFRNEHKLHGGVVMRLFGEWQFSVQLIDKASGYNEKWPQNPNVYVTIYNSFDIARYNLVKELIKILEIRNKKLIFAKV